MPVFFASKLTINSNVSTCTRKVKFSRTQQSFRESIGVIKTRKLKQISPILRECFQTQDTIEECRELLTAMSHDLKTMAQMLNTTIPLNQSEGNRQNEHLSLSAELSDLSLSTP